MNNRAKKAGGFKELISQLEVWEPWYIPGLLLLIFAGGGVTNLLPGLYGKMIDLIELGQIDQILQLIIAYFLAAAFSALLGFAESIAGEYFSYIFVMSDGKITACGSHDDLLIQSEDYRKMFLQQQKIQEQE